MKSALRRDLLRIAASAGIADPRIVPGGRHRRLTGIVGSAQISTVIAGTPSDWRALANLRAQLRRVVRTAGESAKIDA